MPQGSSRSPLLGSCISSPSCTPRPAPSLPGSCREAPRSRPSKPARHGHRAAATLTQNQAASLGSRGRPAPRLGSAQALGGAVLAGLGGPCSWAFVRVRAQGRSVLSCVRPGLAWSHGGIRRRPVRLLGLCARIAALLTQRGGPAGSFWDLFSRLVPRGLGAAPGPRQVLLIWLGSCWSLCRGHGREAILLCHKRLPRCTCLVHVDGDPGAERNMTLSLEAKSLESEQTGFNTCYCHSRPVPSGPQFSHLQKGSAYGWNQQTPTPAPLAPYAPLPTQDRRREVASVTGKATSSEDSQDEHPEKACSNLCWRVRGHHGGLGNRFHARRPAPPAPAPGPQCPSVKWRGERTKPSSTAEASGQACLIKTGHGSSVWTLLLSGCAGPA